MNFYFKLYVENKTGTGREWFRQSSIMLNQKTAVMLEPDKDLVIYGPDTGGIYIITAEKLATGQKKKYMFCKGSKILKSIIIDFSKERHDTVPIWFDKKFCSGKYMTIFSKELDKVKVMIEQDKVKEMLDGLEK